MEKIKLKFGISVFVGNSSCQIYWRCASFARIDWNRNLFITNLDIFSRRQSFAMSSRFFQSYTASSSLLPNHFQQRVYCHLATWLPMQIFSINSYNLSVPSPSAVFCFFKFTSWSTKLYVSSPRKSTGQNRHQQKLFETSSRIRRGQWVWWVGLCYYTAGQELSPFLHQFLNLSQVSNGFWSCHAGRPNWKAGFWPLSLSRQTLYLTKTKLTIQQTLSPWRWTVDTHV